MKVLPSFCLSDYARLLTKLDQAGYEFYEISELPARIESKQAYMRHDVDFHIEAVLDMARLEHKLGVRATYFVPLTLHFNLLYPENRYIVREISKLGHEIGLHYDMETYPSHIASARQHLDWEVKLLSEIIGQPVHSICMHQPHKGQPDPFRELDEYVHPHDPRYQQELLYVSDSCRAWRDESLLTCFGPHAPRRLHLTTHPELWRDGTVNDRMDYLDNVLLEDGIRQHRDYFEKNVRQVWETHSAPQLHDERERKKSSTF